ncbi:cordon-bleu protein-like 1 [Betta splendens]|uniref:Cordon-bleu protein-like 1 n=1 Tax=Betta splendens TaxID=158456 RepID=A0A6P7LXI3_BETSP|nr:cordon-bleu protein-like 1 [Betta splendens]XP_028998617.1 cordon-bleu protein-like 1 [Betta splendens]
MDEPGNPLDRDLSLCVVLPGGLERKALVHGSKPVMDLLVTLCASYHLNPSDYTVEVLSTNKNNISFKPNSPIGSLEAEKIVLKPKGVEEKLVAPYMPEATVRLLINYNKSHKAVVRVNPKVPLEMLLPVVCDKCEFKVETTVLLRDCRSSEPLDMNKTLTDHGLREVFARDTAVKEPEHHHPHHTIDQAVTPREFMSPAPLEDVPKKEKKQKENTGFLSLFRRKKKKNGLERAGSAPASPGGSKPLSVSTMERTLSSCNHVQAELPKKRRAPQPPMGASLSVPNNLGTCHLRGTQRSAESRLRSTKRRAPPPPGANPHQEPHEDTPVKGTVASLNALEELRESDESDSHSPSACFSSSTCPSKVRSSSCSARSSLAHLADPYLPSFRGADISDARCALATILTSSISKGMLVKRLRNSATLPKLHNSSSLVSVTQQWPDNGVCAGHESILNSKLPTEPEWDDPVERKVMTTFKVVPCKKQQSQDPELDLDASDQCQSPMEDKQSEGENNPTAAEEDLCSALGSESETSSPEVQTPDSPDSTLPALISASEERLALPPPEDADERQKTKEEDESEVTAEMTPAAPGDPPGAVRIDSDQSEVPPSPSEESDHSGSDADDKEDEERLVSEEEQGGDRFPPPPPPVFFNEAVDVMEQEEDRAATASSRSPTADTPALSSPHPSSPACSRQSEGPSVDQDPARSAAAPELPDKTSAAPSRFAEAVALAVQRSRLQSQGKALDQPAPGEPHGTVPSAHRSTYQHGA